MSHDLTRRPPAAVEPPAPGRPGRASRRVTIGLGVLALVASAAFLTWQVQAGWDFVLPFRGTKLMAMALVAVAVAASTVVFQTVTGNRILTPSIMGFDSLYVLLQSVLVLSVGAAHLSATDPRLRYLLEVAVMVAASTLLYRWILGDERRSLHLLVLVGIVFGVLFRSLSNMVQRLIDPNEFVVLQDMLFARFSAFDPALLTTSAALIAVAIAALWPLRNTLDVLLLGTQRATSLGVDHRRVVYTVLVAVAVLVSVSTALVGPITFFGLLVAHLAYQLAGTFRHRVVVPVACLLAYITLVLGQLVLERLLGFDTALAVVIEFLGGIVFIVLLLRRGAT